MLIRSHNKSFNSSIIIFLNIYHYYKFYRRMSRRQTIINFLKKYLS